RFLCDYVYMQRRAGRSLKRPLVLIIDEAQHILEHDAVAQQLLTLRHSNIHLIFAVQNPSVVKNEVFNNVDLYLSFRLTDGRERRAIGDAFNLDAGQMDYLATLPQQAAVCFLPHSPVKRSILLNLPFVHADGWRAMPVASFLQELSWVPREQTEEGGAGDRGDDKFDEQTERFLRDVLNQAFEFSGLTLRFERAGIRSASKQGSVIKRLIGDGYLKIWPLAVGRGRPIKLCEPTVKAFELIGVGEWNKGPGSLPVRAATAFLYKKLTQMLGWNWQKEGKLSDGKDCKAVDLLGRDPDNRVVAVEVAGTEKHEAHNALANLAFPEVRKHVVVCLSNSVLRAVKTKLEGFPELRGNERIEVLTLAKALGDGWMP
ncbi:MAG: hypothetical protein GY778_26640, partial [bacterium]|nr:hypothetical protein [bacterium]